MKNGQSTLEYLIILSLVIGVIVVVGYKFKGSLGGVYKAAYSN